MPDFSKHIQQTPSSYQPSEGGVAHKPKKKGRRFAWTIILGAMVVIGFGFGVTAKVILSVNSTNSETGEKVQFFDQLKHLVLSPEKQLLGESEDRVNILLIGIGGEKHQGAYLADTIILASVKPSTGQVALLSIPRDLYVNIPEYGFRKINNAMAFGQSDNYPGGGEVLLSRVVAEVTAQPIQYFARIDFTGFAKVVDDLGGITIDVPQSFVDTQYPDENFGYQTVRFQQGIQEMDGATALKYVRSRHGTNGEGSDFARSKRQQQVLLAIKEKGVAFETLVTPNRIITALSDLGQHNRTNLQIWEILRLANMINGLSDNNIINKVLDTSADGLLNSSTTADGAYILLPSSGTYTEIRALAKNIFLDQQVVKESTRIEVQNGTPITGLAQRVAEDLRGASFTVVGVSNASHRTHTETAIYDLSGGTKPYSLAKLKSELNAVVLDGTPDILVDVNAPVNYDQIKGESGESFETPTKNDVDFLVVVGTDWRSSDSSLNANVQG